MNNTAAQPSMFEMVMPFAVIFIVFYFLLIRPQKKKMKEHDALLQGLKRGDSVVTSSGILATVDGLTDLVATLEIAPNVKIKVLRKQIAAIQNLSSQTTTVKTVN